MKWAKVKIKLLEAQADFLKKLEAIEPKGIGSFAGQVTRETSSSSSDTWMHFEADLAVGANRDSDVPRGVAVFCSWGVGATCLGSDFLCEVGRSYS
ncbi:hypothetical protein EL26_06485 [Tumebacillus flagellatus]|uniref:Uncharacterized protein n=1 Tax=Tumebacillus flagellatus TaxID=1157490 RepID=A0A074ME97_9BACL|nr:hypothetical protein EL26_06485 [Tumebacillus flagellatus]